MRKVILVVILGLTIGGGMLIGTGSAAAKYPPGLCTPNGTGIVAAYPAEWEMTQARANMLCAMYNRR